MKIKCLAQGHNTMPLVKLRPVNSISSQALYHLTPSTTLYIYSSGQVVGLDPVSRVVVVPCLLYWEGSPVLRKREPLFLGQHRVLDHPKRAVSIASVINSFLATGVFCHLLITFANSLDPDQDRYSVCPDLNSNSLTL